MFHKAILLLSLLSLSEAQDGYQCFVEGTCSQNGDTIGLSGTFTTAEECLNFCQVTPDCAWFTYDPANEGEDVNRCYLYDGCGASGPESDAGCADCVSGQVECGGDDGDDGECYQAGICQGGQSLSSTITDTQEECLQECLETPPCDAFSYNLDSTFCDLWLGCPVLTTVACTNCVSGFLSDCPFCQMSGACGGGSGIADSPQLVADETECWQLCDITSNCFYYTYISGSNTCTLFSSCEFDSSLEGSTSASNCPPPDSGAEHCFEDGACNGVSLGATVELTAEDCLQYCQDDVPGCNFFTFWPTYSDSPDPRCEAFASCPVVDPSGCVDCVSGAACDCDCDAGPPANASAVAKFLIALGRDSVGNVEVADLPSALDAAAAAHTTCQQPPTYQFSIETAVAALIDNRVVLCGGGFGGDVTYRDCYALDPLSNRWTDFGASMQQDRAFAASVVVPSVGWWVIGGFDDIDGGVHVTTERYSQANGRWDYGPNLPDELYGHCAVQVDDFTTLIIAGDSEGGEIALRTVYSYDWVVNDFTFGALPPLLQGRESPACGVFVDGAGDVRVVVAGGIVDSFGSETSSTEMLSVRADGSFASTWEQGPSLPFSLTGATMLKDGDDLVLVGGSNNPYVIAFDGPVAGWRIVDGVQLTNGNRVFAPAVAAPDEAFYNCQED